MATKRSPAKMRLSKATTSAPSSITTTSASPLVPSFPIASPSRTIATDALSLPQFLKLLCSSPRNPLTMSEAISIAKVLVPAKLNSPSRLLTLSQVEMARLGIEDEGLRKKLSELTHAVKKGSRATSKGSGTTTTMTTTTTTTTTINKGKRKRGSDLDRPLPTSEVKDDVVDTDLDFEEILYEEALLKKSCVTNRAPVMSAWATVVAERLGFRRQEALSIAQVYTEMNATSKGVSLGIMQDSALNLHIGSSQPFVDLMGRKVPVLSTASGEWRAISKGVVADPQKAFAYVQRAFRQQAGAIIGALRLLAESYDPVELNNKGYGLYIDFRPEVKEWGEKAELFCASILELRRHIIQAQKDARLAEIEGRAKVKAEEKAGGDDETVGNGDRLVKIEDAEGFSRELGTEDVKPVSDAPKDSNATEKPSTAGVDEEDEFDKLLDDAEDFDYDALNL